LILLGDIKQREKRKRI